MTDDMAEVLAGARQWAVDCADSAEWLSSLPAGSVHCAMTSPPYFALRDYKTGTWEGGDDPACDHAGPKKATQVGFNEKYTGKPPVNEDKQGGLEVPFRDTCGKCGARRVDWQIGLEATVADYLARLLAVFDGVRRVLRDDGLLAVNMGDSYASSVSGSCTHMGDGVYTRLFQRNCDGTEDSQLDARRGITNPFGAGNLLGVPWRFALAMQAAGWCWRSTVVWRKLSPMPQSLAGWRWERCRVKVGNNGRQQARRGQGLSSQGMQNHSGNKIMSDAQWSDCPGCDRCSTITGGDRSCAHEWGKLEPGPGPLPLKTESVAVVQDVSQPDAVAGVQVDPLLVSGGVEPPSAQGRNQPLAKVVADGAKVDSSVLADRPVPVEKSPDEVRKKRRRGRRKPHDSGLSGNDTEVVKSSGKPNTAELKPPVSRASVGSEFSDLGRGTHIRPDEVEDFEVHRGNVQLSPSSDTSVGEDESQNVRHVGRPIVEQGDVHALPVSDAMSGVAVGGAESPLRPSPLEPLGAVDGGSAAGTRNATPVQPAGNGTAFQALGSGGSGVETLATGDAGDGRHGVMICKKCGAVKHGSPTGGLVLRRGSWRPTPSWEPVFLFSKGMAYFADGEPVKTPAAATTVSRDRYTRVLDDPDEQFAVRHDHETVCESGANLRDVWDIGSEPLSESHYAAYPTRLVARFLSFACSQRGVCGVCGAPVARVVEREAWNDRDERRGMARGDVQIPGRDGQFDQQTIYNKNGQTSGVSVSTTGWRPTCPHPGDPVPSIVLDPFTGSGSTGVAARQMGLRFVGVDLSEKYVAIAKRRIAGALRQSKRQKPDAHAGLFDGLGG
jgi:DNA modification methylase